MKKNHRIYHAVKLNCPVCGESSMFVNPKLFSLHKLGQVKESCDHCGAHLKPETGFYFGAAYVNWALTVALWVSVLVALKTFNSWGWIEFGFLTHPKLFLVTGSILTVLLFPYIFRLSRSLWASFFVKKS
jgi:hypothetical protein